MSQIFINDSIDLTFSGWKNTTFANCTWNNNCYNCIPKIPDKLYVTISGMTNCLESHNGVTELNLNPALGECWWGNGLGSPYMTLRFDGNNWLLQIFDLGNGCGCFVLYMKNVISCDPTGSYDFNLCNNYYCNSLCCGVYTCPPIQSNGKVVVSYS